MRKTVKIDAPFYLTEDERKVIIDKVCENEPNIEFACFELGGINLSRFKTLCKIQKQYPDAEIFEIQGADKVHTLLKSSHGEEYVGKFRFVVFERYGIDLDTMFREDPVLGQIRVNKPSERGNVFKNFFVLRLFGKIVQKSCRKG